jgi:hypothetical protein
MTTGETGNSITEVTRRAIIDYLTASKIPWAGQMQEDAFLGRLYDLAHIPSTDNRYNDAGKDIWKHRVINEDWDDDWVFYDPRFNLLWATDEEFLRFLCETVRPVVRPSTEQAKSIVAFYNMELKADGWQLVETKQISGRPVFNYDRLGFRSAIFEQPTGWQKVDRQIHEVRTRLDTAKTEEQFQAVGLLCREVLISVAQAVFDPSRHITNDVAEVSETDSRRMLEAIFERELSGSVNEEARAHAKAALKLAVALQHKRTADFRMAALCAEGTSSVINFLAILSEGRKRS